MSTRLPPVHPGEILAEEFLTPLGLSPYRAADLLHVPRTRIERVVRGEAAVSPDTALRLERLFGASAEFWLGIQAQYDIETARDQAAADIAAIEQFKAA